VTEPFRKTTEAEDRLMYEATVAVMDAANARIQRAGIPLSDGHVLVLRVHLAAVASCIYAAQAMRYGTAADMLDQCVAELRGLVATFESMG
jgi:hypothetical protein